MTSYHDCCKEVIERWGGHVAEFLGDGAVIYFGWPTAHEDDAERAVRATLELVAAVARLPVGSESTLSSRAGIATGLVMVGETKSDALAHREGVVGETPNLAARAQALAEPGAVVITPGTRRLIGDRFDLEPLGVHELRGIASPVEVWRVSTVRAQSRFEARVGARVSPLVGRQAELGRLRDAWGTAVEGGWSSVLVLGEAGIGKSRLLEELVSQTATTEREVLCVSSALRTTRRRRCFHSLTGSGGGPGSTSARTKASPGSAWKHSSRDSASSAGRRSRCSRLSFRCPLERATALPASA